MATPWLGPVMDDAIESLCDGPRLISYNHLKSAIQDEKN